MSRYFRILAPVIGIGNIGWVIFSSFAGGWRYVGVALESAAYAKSI